MRQVLVVVLGLALILPTRAAAHQQLLSAAPEEGASLVRAPQEIRLTFNQAVERALARLSLAGPIGEVALAAIEVPSESPKEMVARITGRLVPGVYTVRWLVTGADGHPVRGEYRFTIEPNAAGLALDSSAVVSAGARASGPTAPGQEAPPAEHHVHADSGAGFDAGSPLYAAVRGLSYAALLVVIGAVSFKFLVLSAVRRRAPSLRAEALDRARYRTASVGLIAGAALTVALILRLLAQSAALHGPGAAWSGELVTVMLTRTLWGWGWILQAVATGILLLGLWLAREGRRGGWGLAAVATLALAVTPALSGHAAATSAGAVIADSLHVRAAGGWLGTLLLLLVVGLPVLLRDAGSKTAAAASLLAAFSPQALAFAGVLTLTGIYAAWVHLLDVAALWSSAYGQTLLAKLGALSVVFATGAYNWLRARPALEKRRATAAEALRGSRARHGGDRPRRHRGAGRHASADGSGISRHPGGEWSIRASRSGANAMSRLCLAALLSLLASCDRSPEPEPMPGMGDMGSMGGMMQHDMAGSVDTAGLRDLTVPAEFQRGREIFQANCALCHGDAALGTAQGPPLVHVIYEPSHHADAAFLLAALRGVRAHHWGFGDMPPQPQVSPEEVTDVVQYVRWLQREAGVY